MRRLGLVILSGLVLTSALVYGRTQLTQNPAVDNLGADLTAQGKQIEALNKALADLKAQPIKVALTNCKPADAVASGEQTKAVGITCSANQVMNGLRISSSPYKQTFQPICCDVSAQR